MRIVFMGTPDIAEAALSALLREGHEVVGVYTRADKPQGRKQRVVPSPVKVRAAENRIPIFQPATLKTPAAAEELAALAPDIVVVVAYGRILPPAVLRVPKYGCVNLHVSLLPQYRGAAPIQWAVINGEEVTGVTVMQMDEGLDTGPVLAAQSIEIPPGATAGEVFTLASSTGARLLVKTLADIEAGRVTPTPQTGPASHAPPLTKAMAQIDFALPAKQLHNLVRGCNPWPLAWFACGGKRIKVLQARTTDEVGARAGDILSTAPLTVACGEGALELLLVHPEASRAMTGAEWAAGRRFAAGQQVCDQ